MLRTTVSPPDAQICHVTSETCADAAPTDENGSCQLGTDGSYSAQNKTRGACGNSFCTRDTCCEVQPLVIELPARPELDVGGTGVLLPDTPESPSSIAKRMLVSLKNYEGQQRGAKGITNGNCCPPVPGSPSQIRLGPAICLDCCHANDAEQECNKSEERKTESAPE